MLDDIKSFLNSQNSLSEFVNSIRLGVPTAAFNLPDSVKGLFASAIPNRILYLVKDNLSAIKIASLIEQLSGRKTVVLPAKDQAFFYSHGFSKDALYKRLIAESQLSLADVVVTTPEAIMQPLLRKVETMTFLKGEDYSQSEILNRLIKLGYKRVEALDDKGTFTIHGDILEIFAVNNDNPYHIDFFGDTVESIKEFDREDRKTIKFLDGISFIQANEVVYSDADLSLISALTKNHLKTADEKRRVRYRVICDDIDLAIGNGDFNSLAFASALSENTCYIDDVLSKDTVVVYDEGKRIYEYALLLEREFTERFNGLLKEGETFSFTKDNFLTADDLKTRLNSFTGAGLQSLTAVNPFLNPLKVVNPIVGPVSDYKYDFKEVFADIKNWLFSGYKVVVYTLDSKKAELFCNELSSRDISFSTTPKQGVVGVISEKLDSGFIFHEQKFVVLGSGNLYARAGGERKPRVKRQAYFTPPEAGDYAVHEVYGIGRVLGSKRITNTEGTKDYIAVEYADKDILYIPVEQMDILTRYLGGEKTPRLSKIGGKDFERIKNRAKESIKKMSFDLKKLYEERNKLVGYKFNPDQEMQNLFDEAFEFEDTPDQAQATEEIFNDMTSGKVMDRLVCGDVGFGKTEVALRAVFLAVLNGKQAAMLAPTTILTEQHFNTATNRFKNFGIKIAVLNRFKTPSQQAEILKGLKDGSIDFVIGTHRLLSKDIAFKDLGLLVLDEEQRFGVEHKEKIKLLKTNVDTLTLTATPIPRTLHMSLSGIRSISTINTPPKKRLPVQTYVTEETDTLIKDAISREINRGGQVFVLYNRVESIFAFAEKIKSLIKDVRVTVAHGQMDERTLEKNIFQFYRHESDVLVSTTIIENGIDLPKANTLIVIDADRLGLSTLYQLKGRVGRSDRLAYAYFTFKRDLVLSDNAYQRLNAITEFAEMGSGIKIAMRDLEIRGAGNVLGAEQHGNMDKIGYELYSKLLKEELSGEEEVIPELDIRVTAYIPEEYVAGNSARMGAYKEIAQIKSPDDEREVRELLESAYGELPLEVENLMNIAVVKYISALFKASEINLNKDIAELVFPSIKEIFSKELSSAVDKYKDKVTFSVADKPKIIFKSQGKNTADTLQLMKEFLTFAFSLTSGKNS